MFFWSLFHRELGDDEAERFVTCAVERHLFLAILRRKTPGVREAAAFSAIFRDCSAVISL